MPQEDNRHKCWKSPIMAHLKAVMGLFFCYLQLRRGDTRPHLSSIYLSILESMGVCRPSRALLYLVIYTPPYLPYGQWVQRTSLPLSHSVPSFSGGVSNGRAPLGLWIITTSWLSAGVGSTGRIPLGLWIITSSWLPAYHPFLTVTYLQDAEHGHVF